MNVTDIGRTLPWCTSCAMCNVSNMSHAFGNKRASNKMNVLEKIRKPIPKKAMNSLWKRGFY